MARRQVTILECDRCGRTEEQGPEVKAEAALSALHLSSNLHTPGIDRRFTDLCLNCRRSVTALIDKILLVKKEGAEESEPASEDA